APLATLDAAHASKAIKLRDVVEWLDEEPRISDARLAERLGFERLRVIRELIGRHRAELLSYGVLATEENSPKVGLKPQPPYATAVRAESTPKAWVSDAEFIEPRRQGRRKPGPVSGYYLNEGQALVLCALSRTPAAAAIRRELITV